MCDLIFLVVDGTSEMCVPTGMRVNIAALEDRSSWSQGAATPNARGGGGSDPPPARVETVAGLKDQPKAGLPALDGQSVAAATRGGTPSAAPAAAGDVLRTRDAGRATARRHQDPRPSSAGRASRACDRQLSSRGVGWGDAHVAVHDHSWLSYVEALPDQTGAQCAACLDRTVGWRAAQWVAYQ